MNLSPAVENPVDIAPNRLWDHLKEALRPKIGPTNFRIWLNSVRGAKVDGERLVLSVPNKFVANWLSDYYFDLIEKEGSLLANKALRLGFDICDHETEARAAPVEPPAQRRAPHPLNAKYTFENFVVGSGSQLAHAAARAVADMPGANYNPLFIYGGVGLGKTHLLHAVGIEALKKFPQLRLICLPAEKFMNEYIYAVRNNQMNAFRKKYRSGCDLLLIDDIQFLGGKESTQDEFFHTFNELYHSHRQIVITGDKIPKEIPGLEERLCSRFEWGLVADIQPPDFETRVAILRKKAESDKIRLSEEVALYLAEIIRSNVRELEGTLIRLHAFASLTNSPITVELARGVLQRQARQPETKRRGSVESIQQAVAQYYQIQTEQINSHRRLKSMAHPRQVAMYLCKKHLQLSFPEIGHRFGGKDHTTVLYACRKIELLLESDASLQHDIAILEKTIL